MSARADRITETLRERELDLLLVSDLTNVRYATGFHGTNGAALIGADARIFMTDFRYVEQASRQVADFDVRRAQEDLLAAVRDALPEAAQRLGFDDANLTVKQHAHLRELLPGDVELVAAGGIVETARLVKEPAELERIAAAAALADDVLRWLMERGIVGMTERALAVELEHQMRMRGADDPSFPSIIASGTHSSAPHAEPRDVEIERDVLVTVDMGARLDGYCSDCTRTFATGDVGDDEREVYELVLRAQEAALEAIRPGPKAREVDAVARDLIAAAGHAEEFGHGLGHGVGLDVHERPRLSRKGEEELAAGQVVTVEPGVYLPGRFGVRIEDLVAVTETGANVLTGVPKTLTVIE